MGRVENVISTNGKAEPVTWASARAEFEGLIDTVPVARGQRVASGQVLATIEAREPRAALAAAEARIAQARADIETLEKGGRPAEFAEIETGLRRAQLDREQAQRDWEVLSRLEQKKAATRIEVQDARDRLDRAMAQIRGFESRRGALVNPPDLAAARGRLRDAEAAAALARRQMALASIRAPIAGEVYQLDARAGTFVTPGTLIANIGVLDELKVVVYVDEPELGRVKAGMPVTITWDALPGRQWTGAVEKVPTQIVALGTRQVGEVTCRIDNRDHTLLPGVNITASIRSQVAENALTLPKEVVLRENGQTGVYVVEGETLRWRVVQLGIASLTRVQVLEGVKAGDTVAQPGATPLRDGLRVMGR